MRALRLAGALCAVAAAAAAHEDRTPKRDAVQVGPSEIVVVLDYAVPRGDLARTLRQIFDRDHSGHLDDAETARLGGHLAHEAVAFLAVTVDGAAVKLAVGQPVIDAGGPPDDAISIHLQAVAPIALTQGAHTVRIADHHKDRRFVVPVTVRLQSGVSWRKRLVPQPMVDEKRPLDLSIEVLPP